MISVLLGLCLGAGIVVWAILETPGAANLLHPAAAVLVIGGTLSVLIVQVGFTELLSALRRAASLFGPSTLPDQEAAIAEIVRLAKKAQSEGGLLAVQNDGAEFAEGFLRRALSVAVSSGDAQETRRVMESELRQIRAARLQEADVFQTMASASPILGLMGTLLAMVRVVALISDPTRMGQAMAIALSSDFLALGVSQLFAAPIAGRLLTNTRQELLIREILLEGVVGIAAGRPVYRLELYLAAYARRRARRMQAPAAALRPQRAAA